MIAQIEQLGDNTSRPVKPDFEGERFYHWQHMRGMAEKAGTLDRLPRKPRSGLAEESFFSQVDVRMSRVSFSFGVEIRDGKIIRSY
jgi:hypothetical protein